MFICRIQEFAGAAPAILPTHSFLPYSPCPVLHTPAYQARVAAAAADIPGLGLLCSTSGQGFLTTEHQAPASFVVSSSVCAGYYSIYMGNSGTKLILGLQEIYISKTISSSL